MLKKFSPWPTILWLVPFAFGFMRATVWPLNSEEGWGHGSFLFIGTSIIVSEALLRWYTRKVVHEVRRSRDASMDNLPPQR